MEISEVSQGAPEWPQEVFEVCPSCPAGIASIPDSCSISSRPHPVKRILLGVALLSIQSTFWILRLLFWMIDRITGTSSEKALLYQLGHVVEAQGDLPLFLKKASSENTAAGYVLGELLHLPELYPLMKEILCGANVRLRGDQGYFFRLWKQHPHAYQRSSSHKYRGKECFGLSHFLFWLDLEGNTRFQFENSPLKGFRNRIHHLIDYLRYLRDDIQQGVLGTSPYVETFCIDLAVDLPSHLERRNCSRQPI